MRRCILSRRMMTKWGPRCRKPAAQRQEPALRVEGEDTPAVARVVILAGAVTPAGVVTPAAVVLAVTPAAIPADVANIRSS